MEKDASIYVAGHTGLLGSAIVRALKRAEHSHIITKPHNELDLMNREAVDAFFRVHKPEYVFLAAARVGGIMANVSHPVEFLLENLQIYTHVMRAAHDHKVKKLLFLGSSCVYPKFATQPMNEEVFMTGKLEPTNEAYAIAKIAGISLAKSYFDEYGDNFISVMPSNLYGPGDNFNPESSHVVAGLLHKFHHAKKGGKNEVQLWGSGLPRRELLFVDDCADACVFLMNAYDDKDIINIGTGEDIAIKDLAEIVRKVVGYEGEITFDTSKPDGMAQKLLDVSKLHALGWQHKTSLEEGIRAAYDWFITHSDYAT